MRLRRQRQPFVNEHDWGGEELEVGPGEPTTGPEEATNLANVGRHWAAALAAQQRDVLFSHGLVGCRQPADPPAARCRMLGVHQRSRSRQHQDLRVVIGASAQNHFPLGAQLREHVGALNLHAGSALAIGQNPRARSR